jgi:hypothetical protein
MLNAARDEFHTRQAGSLALATLAQARGAMTPIDANAALSLSGQICDHLLNDRSRAIEFYELAIAAEPSSPLISRRLAQLKAIDEATRRKAAENELLRHRASAGKR